jgi:hypothetical protein
MVRHYFGQFESLALCAALCGCHRVASIPTRNAESPAASAPSARAATSLGVRMAGERGHVMDATTGKPLAGARVQFEPGHRAVTTDSLGSFPLLALQPGRYDVRVVRIGYQSARDSVNYDVGMSCLRVTLTTSPGLPGLCVATSGRSCPDDTADKHGPVSQLSPM